MLLNQQLVQQFVTQAIAFSDYEQEDNILKLKFNDMILSDITSNNILEEVIYTISLSMNDMLGVTEIIFYADDEEIYTSNIDDLMQ